MFIKKVEIKNFKCFKNEVIENFSVPDGTKGGGLNILIGENNSGKTAVFSIFSKLKENSMISNEEKNAGKDVIIRIEDTDSKTKIIQNIIGGSHINLEDKGDSELSYEHFDIIKDNRIWTSGFNGEMEFNSYQINSNFIRSQIDSHLSSALSDIEKNNPQKKDDFNGYMKKIIPQFSEWTIEYSSLAGKSYISYKLADGNSLNIDDSLGGGILNLFRIILSFVEDKKIIIIDEPEAFLHPKAQSKLLEVLLDISSEKQIFISTHSPYMFNGVMGEKASLIILKRNGADVDIKNAKEDWGIFGDYSPTWGEINWFAYDLAMVEFHNELYGFLQAKATDENKENYNQDKFDIWLSSKLTSYQDKVWSRVKKDGTTQDYNATIQTYIRNSIHHPENTENDKYINKELKNSIKGMIDFIKDKG